MIMISLILVSILMGILVASCGSWEYMGCFVKTNDWSTSGTFMQSGHACAEYCFSNKYRYAAISMSECFCGSQIHGMKVNDTECNVTCLDTQYNTSCGSYTTISIYNDTGEREHISTTASTEISCFNGTTLEPERKFDSYVKYISASLVVVTLVMMILCIVMCVRCYRRRRAKAFEISQTLNNSCYRIALPTDYDIEDGNGTRESSIRISADLMGEYDRLKMPEGVIFLDPVTYSHIDTRRLQGACMVTDNTYNRCDLPRSKRIQATANARGYDKVLFSRSGKMKVGPHIPVHRVESDTDYSYDKLQNNVLTKQAGYQLSPDTKQCHVKNISKDQHTVTLVKQLEKLPVKAKRSNTYDEIEVI